MIRRLVIRHTCIPYLNSDSSSSFQWYWLGSELHTNCRELAPWKLSLNVSAKQVSLANTGITKKYDFENEVVVVVVTSVMILTVVSDRPRHYIIVIVVVTFVVQ